MLQTGVMAQLLRRYGPAPPRSILELGSGDGTFMLRVARRLAAKWPGVTVGLLDRQDLVTPETKASFEALGWRAETIVTDAFDGLRERRDRPPDMIVANLFLHHFRRADLARLLGSAARSSMFIAACEPRRSGLALAGSRLVGLIGCNAVTRHDAVVSVRAGFAGRELSSAFEEGAAEAIDKWITHERPAGLFTQAFTASRAAGRAPL